MQEQLARRPPREGPADALVDPPLQLDIQRVIKPGAREQRQWQVLKALQQPRQNSFPSGGILHHAQVRRVRLDVGVILQQRQQRRQDHGHRARLLIQVPIGFDLARIAAQQPACRLEGPVVAMDRAGDARDLFRVEGVHVGASALAPANFLRSIGEHPIRRARDLGAVRKCAQKQRSIVQVNQRCVVKRRRNPDCRQCLLDGGGALAVVMSRCIQRLYR